MGQKTGLFLCVNNFATFNVTKVCSMSKVSKFCLEKEYYSHVSEFEYSSPSLLLNIHYPSTEHLLRTLTLFSKLYGMVSAAVSKIVKLTLTRNYNKEGAYYCDHIVEQGSLPNIRCFSTSYALFCVDSVAKDAVS